MAENGSLRASDQDREAVAEVLRQAHAEGRLDYGELDERLTLAYAARTLGELERLTVDLPRSGRQAVEPARDRPIEPAGVAGSFPARRDSHPALRASWYVYAVAVGINLVVWAAVSLSTQEWIYFWPIWVAGPWGVVLLAGTLFNRPAQDR
jgi:uncharacterized protein DUF1707